MKIFKAFKLKYAVSALFLMIFTAGCQDQMVGVEGVCPEVQSTFPANSAMNVDLDAVITVTFTDKVNPATINASAFVLSDNSAKQAKGASDDSASADTNSKKSDIDGVITYNDDTNTMSFTPDAPLSPGTVYTGRVTTAVQDPLGNAMLEDYVWTFTTEDAPLVVSTNPTDEAQNVPLNQILTATFAQAMDISSLDETSFTLFDGTTQIDGSVSYSNSVVSFEPNSDLLESTTYTATITTGAQNEAGTSLDNDFIWTFTTVTIDDAPLVLSTNPADDAENVALNQIVTATFTQAMDLSSLDDTSFTLFTGTTQIDGSVSYSNSVVSFESNSDLLESNIYTATITTAAQNESGIALENDFMWSFTTVAIDAPLVESTDPQDGDIDVELTKIVTATFNQQMDPLTLDENSFTLVDDASAEVTGTVSYSNSVVSFEPDSDLEEDMTYTATITTAAQNESGTALENDFMWSFTTVAIDAPLVESTDPQDGDIDVELTKIVTATFNQQMDPLTLDENSFTLVDDASAEVTGTVSYSNSVVSFEPDSDLQEDMTYTATITTAAQNESGTALENDYEWSFTTEAIVDAPQVESTDPEDGDIDVELSKIVTATFNQQMDPLTLDENSFTLVDDASAEVTGTVSYNNFTVSFEPDSDLEEDMTYTATITTAAENEAGISLENDYEWSFTTETLQQQQSQLGSAETYGLMATSAITNTGNTVINGDVSLEPGTSITGFPPGEINGALNVNNTESAQARADLLEAYNYYKNLPPGTTVPAGADLGALYPTGIAPGTYTSGSTMMVNTTLVLDAGGDPNAIWVFQIGSSLTTGADVILANGANENNVFWVPTEDATIGVGTTFNGTIVSGRDVTANTGATINGRILAGAINAGTIALDDNTVNVPGF